MHSAIRASLVSLFAVGTLTAAPAAWAGCSGISFNQPSAYHGNTDKSLFMPADYTVSPSFGLATHLAAWREGAKSSMFVLADFEDSSIVGMWAVTFTAGGKPVDTGYVQWHSDGTELMNSAGHAAAEGNFCMGVWKRTGPRSYHLNHFALAYNPATNQLAARINIKEDVTVGAGGATYSGPFTLTAYDPQTGAQLGPSQSGQVTGQRVPAN
jgi:hypothetical protein